MSNGNKGIFDTLRSKSAFLRMREYGSDKCLTFDREVHEK